MRRRKSQRVLCFRPVDHPHAREVEAIGEILEAQPGLEESIRQYLLRGVEHPETGATGRLPSQVLRALLVMRLNDLSFRKLAFHLADSITYRRFCGFGAFEKAPSRSTLAENLGKLRAETLEAINAAVVTFALKEGVDDGRTVRGDAFLEGGTWETTDERRRAHRLAGELHHFADLLDRVIDQTQRRVIHGEKVPARENVLSLFEPHTDLIVKDNREPVFGHKVYLTGGASGLIFDCQVARGNPADSTRTVPLVRRHRERYGFVPEQLSLDGGFASRANLEEVKELGVEDVVFRKSRGLKISDMVRESWIYRKLRKFRAGIEGVISFLKHVVGLRRCPWHGFDAFRAYVQGSVLAANLLVLARHRMA